MASKRLAPRRRPKTTLHYHDLVIGANISQDILHCWLLPKNIVLRMLNKSSGGSILYGLGFGLGSTPGPCPSLKLPPVNHRWKANLMDKGRLSYAELHQVCLNASLEHFRLTRF